MYFSRKEFGSCASNISVSNNLSKNDIYITGTEFCNAIFKDVRISVESIL